MTDSKQDLTAADLGLTVENDGEPIDVLDLPQLHTKPSARVLLSTLAELSSEPPSWEATPRSGTPRSGTPRSPLSGTSTPSRRKRKVKSEGLPPYLTKIISSRLAWIDNDDEKEQVWEAASQRLSERSGRTAMGAMSRMFAIPIARSPRSVHLSDPSIMSNDEDTKEDEQILDISIHEPALTADNLGLKTWASSYLLAKKMGELCARLPELDAQDRLLELGSGTGLVGLASAAIIKRHVYLTDLPDIVPNLDRNSNTNQLAIQEFGGSTSAHILDWSCPHTFNVSDKTHDGAHSFRLILAADPIYDAEHPALLVNAIDYHLSKHEHSRAVVAMPIREAYGAERDDFRERMKTCGLHILEQGEEVGFDDWTSGTNEDDLTEVRCGWSVWGWR